MMKLQFQTNIMCNNCIATISPFLDDRPEIHQWSVDLKDPRRILTVETELPRQSVQELIEKAGYKAEPRTP